MKFKVANASEYLVITGAGIKDVKLAKKAWVLPWQSCTTLDLSPVNYTFELQAMSAEKLPFKLPSVFTIGPRVDDHECLLKYAKLLSSHDKLSNDVNDLVQGVIEGETRVLAASMTMDQIFRGTKEFKQGVFEKVQLELNQFGLLIYNANVKQLVDVPGHEYFSYLGKKTQMEAANQAKVDVAEAKKKGEVGAKLREGETLQNAAKIDAETKIIATQKKGEGDKEEINVRTSVKVFENLKEAEVAEANAELARKKAEWSKVAKLAEMETTKAVSLREAELQGEVERMNAKAKTEKLRADYLTKASVEYETKVQMELNQFGLLIYNANVKQLVDVPGHEYFSYLGKKTQMEAANQAKVDVAEAKKKGEVGAKLREGETLQNAAKIDAETKIIATQKKGEGDKEEIKVRTSVKVFENSKEAEVAEANAELARKKAEWSKVAKLAEMEATKAVSLREAELQGEVERMNAKARTEKLRADYLTKASVEYETKVGHNSRTCPDKNHVAAGADADAQEAPQSGQPATGGVVPPRGLQDMSDSEQEMYWEETMDAVEEELTQGHPHSEADEEMIYT
ncbi:hypothetical protein Ahy_B08g089291 isoform J [Arachis hypogaea]|uniref:Flotillin-like n=1 Tax=Arachis hypogaea TaxID=3818 RepID=A0A444XXQ2_ARAHY|nr:hypothetical protein Ahy_B08g089291 isoform J [Arachis hypogaea]